MARQVIIQELFSNDCGEMYLCFVHGQRALFNKIILAMETTKASATDIAIEVKKLKSNIEESCNNKFIPQGAKKNIQGPRRE